MKVLQVHNSVFLQLLIDHRIVNELEMQKLFLDHDGKEFSIASFLFDSSKLLSDKNLIGKLYGSSINKAYMHLDKTFFQPSALSLIDRTFAVEKLCIPIYQLGDALTVAMTEPNDKNLISQLEKLSNSPTSTVFAFPKEIEDSIDIQYGSKNKLEELSSKLSDNVPRNDDIDSKKLSQLAGSEAVIELVRGLLLYCLKHDASDIHIQPTAKSLLIRYRVDGVLQTLLELPLSIARPILSRLKVMASLDITERRLPLDGRVSLEMKGNTHDFRLSTSPAIFGEKAVIRAIGQSSDNAITPMDKLGLSNKNIKMIERLIKCPNGVLFVTGPTGSGKTTTLYSILSKIHQPEINIVTVEDPVEYRIDGITQIQTNSLVGLDFARALRSILRQDPEVILIGEIRDLETAKIAAEAALTGHLVMTTMHTNSAIQAVTRLVEIGVEPFLVAPSVIGVVAQRLVRRICEHCKESYEPSQEIIDLNFYNIGDNKIIFYKGAGCENCNHTGYSKRTAIHEVFILNDTIRRMISDSVSIQDVEKESIQLGFKPLRYDGMIKVLEGLTTLDEINKVTQDVLF